MNNYYIPDKNKKSISATSDQSRIELPVKCRGVFVFFLHIKRGIWKQLSEITTKMALSFSTAFNSSSSFIKYSSSVFQPTSSFSSLSSSFLSNQRSFISLKSIFQPKNMSHLENRQSSALAASFGQDGPKDFSSQVPF